MRDFEIVCTTLNMAKTPIDYSSIHKHLESMVGHKEAARLREIRHNLELFVRKKENSVVSE